MKQDEGSYQLSLPSLRGR